MTETTLTVSGPQTAKKMTLNPQGTILGRGSNCDVTLDHSSVSRIHARIYQDPFGRWIIEDLESRNGVLVAGQRVKAQAVLPGQKINISHFNLALSEDSEQKTSTAESIRSAIPIIDKGSEENIVSYKADHATILTPALMQNLNELTSRLLKLTNPSQLYFEACLSLAQMLDTLVAVVRLPCDSEPLSGSPDILACHFGRDVTDPLMLQTSNLHLSRRILEEVRSTDTPVMASSSSSADRHPMLTVVDESSPHIVFSARVNDSGDTLDVLYLDILQSKVPKEMFDFIEATARQINFVQKHLFFIKLQKQEKALREANIQLREKDRIKDEYVSRVTHDIKGHLTAIQSCLYIAADLSSGPLNEKQADFLGRSRRRTAQLSDFVNELLNLTQMRLSGKFETAAFSLPDAVSRALSTVERKATDKSITLTSNVDPSVGMIVGNQFSINELITNLLFNAIKYTPEKKTVHLEAKTIDDKVQIDFSDTGIGIPADELGNVFDEFFRAANAKKTEKDGSGLGLSIVKQIVERHGGNISVKSTEGKGSTFTVILPKGDITPAQS
ncbi:MAG: ATP-binding protein [Planctomycetota bacterium]|jgi:signal transduction histidine kinase